jgi:hypothetical protein
MARIRNIKPAFFKDEDLADLSFAHRLLFAGLWTLADKNGTLEDRPRYIRAELFPYDDVDAGAMLSDLVTAGFLCRYTVTGREYLHIPTFSKHQRISGDEQKSESAHPLPPVAVTAPVPEEAGKKQGRSMSEATPTQERSTDECGVLSTENGVLSTEHGVQGGGGKPTAAVAAFPRPLPPVGISADAWQEVVADWNAAIMVAPELPKAATALQSASRNRITKALRELPDLSAWRDRFDRVARSRFCRGTNDRGWTADLWWTLEHGDAIDAGRYDDKDRATAPAPVSSRYDIDLDAAVQAQLALRRPS